VLFAVLIAVVPVAVTVVMHAAGLSLVVRSLRKSCAALPAHQVDPS